jgi:hypothetical protein
MKEIQIRRREIQIFRKRNPSQIQIQPNPGHVQQSWAKIQQRKSLDFLRRIEPYQRVTPTPTAFFSFVRRFRLKGGHGQRRRCLLAPVCRSFSSSFRGPPVSRASEGLAPFYDRRRLGALSARLGGRGASLHEKGNAGVPGSPGDEPGTKDLAEKTGRSIRRPAEIRPLHK